MTDTPGKDFLTFELTLDKDFFQKIPIYALLNYEELIVWYKLPWYKKIFTEKPIKVLIELKPEEDEI